MAICSPLFYRTKRSHSFIYIFAIFCFIVFVNIPHFLELKIEENEKLELKITDLRENRIYYYIYGVAFKFLFQYIIPFTIMIVLNVKVWKVLRRQNIAAHPNHNNQTLANLQIHLSSTATTQRRLQSELAKLGLIIVVVLMVCVPVGFINDVYEAYHGIQKVYIINLLH